MSCACAARPPEQVCDVNGVCVDAAEDEIFKLTTREGQLVVEAETVRRRCAAPRCAPLHLAKACQGSKPPAAWGAAVCGGLAAQVHNTQPPPAPSPLQGRTLVVSQAAAVTCSSVLTCACTQNPALAPASRLLASWRPPNGPLTGHPPAHQRSFPQAPTRPLPIMCSPWPPLLASCPSAGAHRDR